MKRVLTVFGCYFGLIMTAFANEDSIAVGVRAVNDGYAGNANASIGSVAQNIFGTVMGVEHLVKVLCVFVGMILILFSIAQYNKHRKNPIQVTIGSVLVTFFIGVLLVGLVFIPFQIS